MDSAARTPARAAAGPGARLGALLRLAAVVAVEVAAVAGLRALGSLPYLRVGWADPARWLAVTPVEDVLASVVRLAALGCAWWLLAGTVLYTLARASRVPAALAAVQWAAPASVRRVADRAVAMTVAGSALLGGRRLRSRFLHRSRQMRRSRDRRHAIRC